MSELRNHPGAMGLVIGLVLVALVALGAGLAQRGGDVDELSRAELDGLVDIPWPSLDALEEPDREQIEEQRLLLTQSLHSGADRAMLAQTYGRLGQILLTFDLAESAQVAFENTLRLQPDDGVAYYYLGYLHASQQDWQEAAERFAQALALRPEDGVLRVRLAEVYRELGRPEDARPLLMDALDSAEASARARYVLGQLAADAGDDRSAIANYNAALELQPSADRLHALAAEAWRRLEQPDRAATHDRLVGETDIFMEDPLIFSLNRFRKGPTQLLQQGTQLMDLGRHEMAADLFEQASQAAPDNLSAWLNLGAARFLLGDGPAAKDAFERALEIDPQNSKARYNLAILARSAGDEQSAESQLRSVLESDPGNLEARLTLASMLRQQARCAEAIDHYRQYLEIDPASKPARLQLILCLTRTGDRMAALEEAELGYQSDPQSPGFLDALVRLLATDPDPSLRDGARAVELGIELVNRATNVESGEALAMAHAAAGDFERASRLQEQLLERVQQQRPGSDWIDFIEAQQARYAAGELAEQPWPDFVFEE